MDLFFAVFIFILGTVVGSFLNVLIDRLQRDEKITGRSYCDHCYHQLSGWDLIPIISFFWLRGRCRYCRKKISWQYPLVEAITGVFFVLTFLILINARQLSFDLVDFKGLGLLLVEWGISACLVVIFFSDLKYQLISDYILLSLAIFSILFRLFNGWSVAFLVSGLVVCLPIFLIYYLSGEKAMGLGDVYLAGIIGFLLGWQKGFLVLYLAFVFGGLVGLYLILSRRKKLKSRIAFGPFLVSATLIMLFWGDKILALIVHFYG